MRNRTKNGEPSPEQSVANSKGGPEAIAATEAGAATEAEATNGAAPAIPNKRESKAG
jgi:hypothetical protein